MTAPAPGLVVPMLSAGTPIARSSRPSPFRSPAASAAPNESPASAASAMPALFWLHSWLPVEVDAAGGAVEDRRRRRRAVVPMLSPGHPDREVGPAVAVEVAGGERRAERVAALGRFEDAGAVLGPQLVAGRGQPAAGAVDHVDRAGAGGRPDAVAGRPDGEVVPTVAVQVGGRERRPEPIAGRGASAIPAPPWLRT